MAIDVEGLIGGLIGGDSWITQIFAYNALSQILQPLLTPFSQELLNKVWSANPDLPLSPADLADMVIKAIRSESDAAAEATLSGLSNDRFAQLVKANGEPPGLESVLQWARRGFLPFDDHGPGVPSVPEAIRTSRIYNSWTPVILDAQFLPLTVADAVNAWVRAQIAPADALQYLYFNGIQEKEATILYNTAGRPPAPGQLGELVNRGVIPVHGTGPLALSFEQGVIESDIKDKWEPILESLIVKLPGVFEIRLMQQQGAITAEEALTLYLEEGLPSNVAQQATAAASVSKTAKAKELAASTVEKLYTDQIISAQDAITDLGNLGYDQQEAEYILATIDFAQQAKAISSAVTAVKGKYLAKRISLDDATALLQDLGMSAEQITQLTTVWQVEIQAEVQVLTTAQILDAVEYSIATQDWAMQELVAKGYTPEDAWVLISVKLKGPQPNPPAGIPPQPPPPPPTSTTA